VIDPGPVAQGRALTRLGQEYRGRYRRIYLDAPGNMARSSRRAWTLKQLTLEYPERYRELYAEEIASRSQDVDLRSINPKLVGSASGPGPWHAVLADESATACGRTRIRTYPASPDRQMNCTYCADELREKPTRTADPQFGERVAAAEECLREFADLQQRLAVAEESLFGALSVLRTPPGGTAERGRFAALLSGAVEQGLTLRDVGKRMGLSGERVRQLAAEHAAVADA